MADKKIAVHVTNEEQWNEVREYYGNHLENKWCLISTMVNPTEFAQTSDDDWGRVGYYERFTDEYKTLEFNEWKAQVKEDNMVEKIEVPQAVYDEFKSLVAGGATYGFMKAIDQESDEYPHMYRYLFETESTQVLRQNQLNLAKVIAGEAEFVPIEERYYWQDKQGKWLGYFVGGITIFSEKDGADKLTESEIRDKTSFDTDKLKKVSE